MLRAHFRRSRQANREMKRRPQKLCLGLNLFRNGETLTSFNSLTGEQSLGQTFRFTPCAGSQFLSRVWRIVRLPRSYMEILWPYQARAECAQLCSADVRPNAESGGRVSSTLTFLPKRAGELMNRFGLKKPSTNFSNPNAGRQRANLAGRNSKNHTSRRSLNPLLFQLHL
jgi:hypothetical protein